MSIQNVIVFRNNTQESWAEIKAAQSTLNLTVA